MKKEKDLTEREKVLAGLESDFDKRLEALATKEVAHAKKVKKLLDALN